MKYYETLVYNLIKPYFQNKYGKGREYEVTINDIIRTEDGDKCRISYKKTEFQPLREIIGLYMIYDICPLIEGY